MTVLKRVLNAIWNLIGFIWMLLCFIPTLVAFPICVMLDTLEKRRGVNGYAVTGMARMAMLASMLPDIIKSKLDPNYKQFVNQTRETIDKMTKNGL